MTRQVEAETEGRNIRDEEAYEGMQDGREGEKESERGRGRTMVRQNMKECSVKEDEGREYDQGEGRTIREKDKETARK